MNRLVIKHGVARKDWATIRRETGIFSGPRLTKIGFNAAWDLGKDLREEGIVTSRIASSKSLRSIQTALAISRTGILPNLYPSLDEVPSALSEDELTAMLVEGRAPGEALEAGERLVANPPVEPIWISHGLTIAGLTAVVRIRQGLSLDGYNLLPSNLEVRELEI